MSMNLIAMLVSLAMMLTGAGGAVQTEALPATATARTLTLSNVSVTWNGEPLHLAPQAHIGVSTDGKKAVYDFGVDLGDKKLLPVQVVASESGITALSGNSGAAVTVSAEITTSASAAGAGVGASAAGGSVTGGCVTGGSVTGGFVSGGSVAGGSVTAGVVTGGTGGSVSGAMVTGSSGGVSISSSVPSSVEGDRVRRGPSVPPVSQSLP